MAEKTVTPCLDEEQVTQLGATLSRGIVELAQAAFDEMIQNGTCQNCARGVVFAGLGLSLGLLVYEHCDLEEDDKPFPRHGAEVIHAAHIATALTMAKDVHNETPTPPDEETKH